ncbi:MAG: TolC family protein [Pirellulales bacterium]
MGEQPLAPASPVPAGTPLGLPGQPAGQPVTLETAMEWTLSGNPDLVAMRQNLRVSAEALAVARRFPTSLNPMVSVDVKPWTFGRMPDGSIERLDKMVTLAWAQPIEVGHRTSLRASMASATYHQTQWNILQAELTALVQTYRFHQTATYRREKIRIAANLVDFNVRLVDVMRRQMEANQVTPADLVLAEVENQTTRQQLETSRQEYAAALAELRQQMGIPEYAASTEPAGALRVPAPTPPGEEDEIVRTAVASRPEIHAARAQAANSRAALCLARADRIPIPSIGPTYERNESGDTFYGLVFETPVPIWNAGGPLVCQRQAEYQRDVVALQQVERRTVAQVKAALVKWNQTQQILTRTNALLEPIRQQSARMERLFEAGQTDLVKLLQVRQRLIEAENGQLDAAWQATQAYADLLTAMGATPLIGSLPGQPEAAPSSADRAL